MTHPARIGAPLAENDEDHADRNLRPDTVEGAEEGILPMRIWSVFFVTVVAVHPVSGAETITFEDFETGDARFFSRSMPPLPSTVCVPPAGLVTPEASTVLGDGTPGSVNRAQIQTALDAGGHIVFDLGPAPQTIVLDQELVITREVVLDGGDLVTLSGGDAVRVVRVVPPWNPADRYTATLQRLRIVNGRTPAGATGLPGNSGAGVLVANGGAWQEVSLVVVGCTFVGNTATQLHQDGGGGAIYAIGADRVVVVDSVFEDNSGSNGGAEVPAVGGVAWADPLLSPLADNGGPVATMAPGDLSPLLGAALASPEAADARGRARTAPADVGAFETP